MIDNELIKTMFWMAYRYGIGRLSCVSSYAYDMSKPMYDMMNADERRHTAADIRMHIADNLRMMPFGFTFDNTVPRSTRKPYEMFCEFMNAHTDIDLTEVTRIECSLDPNKSEMCYFISTVDKPQWERKMYQYEIDALQPWADLAAYMDESDHVMVEFTGNDGRLHRERCYPSYTGAVKPAEPQPQEDGTLLLEPVAWQYQLVYRPTKYGVSNRFIDGDFTTKIERIEQ